MWLIALRIGLPVAIAVAGVVLLAAGHGDTAIGLGGTLVGVALLVVLANVLFRVGVQGDAEREHEEAARRHFERTGRWP